MPARPKVTDIPPHAVGNVKAGQRKQINLTSRLHRSRRLQPRRTFIHFSRQLYGPFPQPQWDFKGFLPHTPHPKSHGHLPRMHKMQTNSSPHGQPCSETPMQFFFMALLVHSHVFYINLHSTLDFPHPTVIVIHIKKGGKQTDSKTTRNAKRKTQLPNRGFSTGYKQHSHNQRRAPIP